MKEFKGIIALLFLVAWIGFSVCCCFSVPFMAQNRHQLDLADTEILQLQEETINLQAQLDDWESVAFICQHCEALNGFGDAPMFTIRQLNLAELGEVE